MPVTPAMFIVTVKRSNIGVRLAFPRHVDGISSLVPGFSFLGMHLLHTRRSSLLAGAAKSRRLKQMSLLRYALSTMQFETRP